MKSIREQTTGFFIGLCVLLIQLACTGVAVGQTDVQSNPGRPSGPVLVLAVLCESLRDYRPVRPAVIFSIRQGKVFCFTEFDQISTARTITHKWHRRDLLVTTVNLNLQPGRWSTYSSIDLRESDRGPWRVEITDDRGDLLAILRFSIVD